MKLKSSFLLLLILPFIACSSGGPPRTFSVKLFLIDFEERCIYRKDGDTIEKYCYDEDNLPDGIISITVDDYKKERDFQEIIRNSCEKWK